MNTAFELVKSFFIAFGVGFVAGIIIDTARRLHKKFKR